MGRWGLGPVFVYEWRALSRRPVLYVARSLFVLGLLAGMGFIWSRFVDGQAFPSIRAQAAVGKRYYETLVGMQLLLVLVVTPTLTAGAVCLDRARGTLAHLLVTDLSDAEIVLGKLAARLLPAVGLVACALPTMSIGTLLGGMDPVAVSLAFLVTMATAVFACALAFTLSVWAKKAHEVLIVTYAIFLVLMLPEWITPLLGRAGMIVSATLALREFNPFWLAFAPYWSPGRLEAGNYWRFLAASLGASAVLIGLAIWRIRAEAVREAGRSRRARRLSDRLGWLARWKRWLPGPSLDGNPVLWREWHRNRPSAWVRLVWLGFAGWVVIGGIRGAIDLFQNGPSPGPTPGAVVVLIEVSLGFLLLSASAATSLAEERARGSLDVLLATTLPTRSILWGKWWAAFRWVPLLAIWPGLYAAGVAFYRAAPPGGGVAMRPSPQEVGLAAGLYAVALMVAMLLAHGAAITSLGLALATWNRRLGRAVALCVLAYLLIAVGWPLSVGLLISSGGGIAWQLRMGLNALSPFVGAIELCEELCRPGGQLFEILAWLTFWTIGLFVVSFVLLGLTFSTFDRCLGRVSDWGAEFEPWDDLFAPPLPVPPGPFARVDRPG